MGFADFYFDKYQSEQALIKTKPAANLGIVVTIPCFNEQHTIKALESLYCCIHPDRPVEVIILVNFPENSEAELGLRHTEHFKKLQDWCIAHPSPKISFYPLLIKLPHKTAGVGHARKIAMDEAVRRFNLINNSHGIIVGFDADCTCDSNYLTAIEQQFIQFPKTTGCSIYYEHPLEGNEFPDKIYSAIIQYELYLRYYIEELRIAGFPYAFHTLGSSFAVRADIYTLQGGMNKRKAGEDFYFLHKIIPLGNYYEINNTTVIPSPRESDRVPFGTGTAVSKILESGQPVYLTFNPLAFSELKAFFSSIPSFFGQPSSSIKNLISQLHPSLIQFLETNNIFHVIEQINKNSTRVDTFTKRFYSWFNGLMVLQYLNEAHPSSFEKIPVNEAANTLLKNMNKSTNESDAKNLLSILRKYQKNLPIMSSLVSR